MQISPVTQHLRFLFLPSVVPVLNPHGLAVTIQKGNRSSTLIFANKRRLNAGLSAKFGTPYGERNWRLNISVQCLS